MNKGGLGRGLEALLPQEEINSVTEINISDIVTRKKQPRKYFDEASLNELAGSIKEHGIIEPIIVKRKDGSYLIVAGERRYRAAKLAGLSKIPVIIKDLSDSQIVEIALIENLQREDLNPIEEALAFKSLLEEYSLTQDEVAKRVGKSRPFIANSIRLLNLDERVMDFIIIGNLTNGHARALLSAEDKDMQYEIAKKIISEGLNVRQTEMLIKKLTSRKNNSKKIKNKDHIYKDIEDNLEQIIGTKINIVKGRKKGKVVIEFYSDDDLNRIYDLICNR